IQVSSTAFILAERPVRTALIFFSIFSGVSLFIVSSRPMSGLGSLIYSGNSLLTIFFLTASLTAIAILLYIRKSITTLLKDKYPSMSDLVRVYQNYVFYVSVSMNVCRRLPLF